MHFARPEAFWLFVALIPIALWVARGGRQRARGWAALGRSGKPRGDGGWWWLGAAACLIVALAQPRWGKLPGWAPAAGQDVVLLVDVSRSMAAEDAVPSRLGVAIEAGESLIAALGAEPSTRAAVVAFAGRGMVRCPLTENLGVVAETLRGLRPGSVEPGGSNLAAGLDASLDAFDTADRPEGRAIVVFSDGEDPDAEAHAAAWAVVLHRLKAAQVLVHAVAIGDPEQGHEVPSGREGEPLRYQGEIVRSRRSDAALREVADATGGAVVPLGLKTADLGALYRHRIAPIARRQRELIRPPERAERFGLFLIGALVLGLIGSWPGPRCWRRAALVVLATAALALGPGADAQRESLAELIEAGRRWYAAGDYRAAQAAFEKARALDPKSPIASYDLAATLYQLGRFAEALALYQEARPRAGAGLRTKIDYALGNTALALGDIPGALQSYEDCLASRVSGAAYDAVRRDAAINREFAVRHASAPPRPPGGGGARAASRAPAPRPPRSRSKANAREPAPSDAGGPNPPGAPNSAPPGRRGPGGAGGHGPNPSQPGSPEARLAAALEHVREARAHRLEDQPPPAAAGERKDW
jgi:Ca-activated chloride channel family protein